VYVRETKRELNHMVGREADGRDRLAEVREPRHVLRRACQSFPTRARAHAHMNTSARARPAHRSSEVMLRNANCYGTHTVP
jgi:hypothetical protein